MYPSRGYVTLTNYCPGSLHTRHTLSKYRERCLDYTTILRIIKNCACFLYSKKVTFKKWKKSVRFNIMFLELKKDQFRYLRNNWLPTFTDPHLKGAPHLKGGWPELYTKCSKQKDVMPATMGQLLWHWQCKMITRFNLNNTQSVSFLRIFG